MHKHHFSKDESSKCKAPLENPGIDPLQSVHLNGFEGNRKNVQRLYWLKSKCKRKRSTENESFSIYLGLKKVGVYEIMVGLSKGQA